MSVKVMAAVWELDLPTVPKMVLLALADHAHDDGSRCFPGVERLAWKSGLSRRAVQGILRILEAKGLIEVAQPGGGRGRATEYRVNTEMGERLAPFQPTDRAKPTRQRAKPTAAKGEAGTPQPSVPALTEPSGTAALVVICPMPSCRQPSPCWLHEPHLWGDAWRQGGRDALWEAMITVMGCEPLTPSERGRWNRAVADLRTAKASPTDVVRRAAEYRRRMPEVEFTPTALAANWSRLAIPKTGRVTATLAAIHQAREHLATEDER